MALVTSEMLMGGKTKMRVRNTKLKIVSGQLNLPLCIGRLDQPVVLKLVHDKCCYFLSFLTYFHFSCGFLNGKPTMNKFLRTIKRRTECKTTEYRVIIFSLEMVS